MHRLEAYATARRDPGHETSLDRGVMAIECKSARGRLTVEQSDWLDTLNAAGVPAVVVRPADYDETIATITSRVS